MTVDGEPRAVTDVMVPNWMSRVVLTLASPVTSGQTVTVAYRQPPRKPLQDASGLYALPFDAYPVPYETGDIFPHNRPATGKPKITWDEGDVEGEVKVGDRLHASHWCSHRMCFNDPAHMRARETWFYRWVRVASDSSETEIGSNSAYYRVKRADMGSEIKVEVRFLDGRGNPERVVSNPVGPVPGTAHQATSTDEEAPLTASFEDLPSSHDGETAFWFNLVFNQEVYDGDESVNKNQAVREALTITGGRARASRQLEKGSFDAFRIEVEPEGPDMIIIALVPPLGDCTEETPTCTPDGRKLTTLLSLQVQGPQQGLGQSDTTPVPKDLGRSDTTPALTASFEDLPAEHDGKKAFWFTLVFNQEVYDGDESVNKNKAVREALEITEGRARASRQLVRGSFDAFRIEVEPAGHETVTIRLAPPNGACEASTPTCTPEGARLGKAIERDVAGPVTISVTGDEVQEGTDAALEFTVELSREAGHEITVDYETVDGAAEAGIDYVATSGVLRFEPGETNRTVAVSVFDDAIDEGDETMTLRLSDATDAYILQSEATGKIKNSDLMPQAWLARFGRTVAEQVLDAVEGRLRSAPPAGTQVTVAGQRLGGAAPDAEALEEADTKARLESVSAWLAGETQAREGRSGPRTVAPRALLTGSSFALTAGSDGPGGGLVSLWGRGAVSRFDGREDELILDGEVTGALLGADWTRERWTAGLLLSHARGEGEYRGASGGEVDSTVTGLYPYGRYALSERVTLWGTAGYGSGELTLTPDDGGAFETDMDLAMAAAGLRGVVVEAPEEGGPEVAVKTDALGCGPPRRRCGAAPVWATWRRRRAT